MVGKLETYGNGLFLVLEGLDGCGKSALAKLLKEWLLEKFLVVSLTREPTNNPVGQEIRSFLQGKVSYSSSLKQLLYAADRGIHLEKDVTPVLEQKGFVICERYILSSYAYGKSDGADLTWLKEINSKFIAPNLTILLDADPGVCIKRIDHRGDREHFEKEEMLRKVRNAYLELLPEEFPNHQIIDVNREIPEIFEDIKQVITPLVDRVD